MCSVNHERRSIFIHIPKNGGSYVENILTQYYGFDLNYMIKPDNYGFRDVLENTPFLPKKNRGAYRYYSNSVQANTHYNMNDHRWRSYFKFAFVRDPYTRLVSAYEFLKGNYRGDYYSRNEEVEFPTLKGLLQKQADPWSDPFYRGHAPLFYYHYYHCFIRQYEHLIDDEGNTVTDYVGRFEDLGEDFTNALRKIGFPDGVVKGDGTEKINETTKTDPRNYYDEDVLQFVNDYFREDFERFGYKRYEHLDDLYAHLDLAFSKTYQDTKRSIRGKILYKGVYVTK